MASVAGSSSEAFFCVASRMKRVGAHDFFQRLDRLFAADEERNDHVREHHDVAQRQNRIGPGFAGVQRRSWFGAGHGQSPFVVPLPCDPLCAAAQEVPIGWTRRRSDSSARSPDGPVYPGEAIDFVRDAVRTLYVWRRKRVARKPGFPVKIAAFVTPRTRYAATARPPVAADPLTSLALRRWRRPTRRCGRCGRRRCRAAGRCPRPLPWRSPLPRRLRGSADRTWCRAECSP